MVIHYNETSVGGNMLTDFGKYQKLEKWLDAIISGEATFLPNIVFVKIDSSLSYRFIRHKNGCTLNVFECIGLNRTNKTYNDEKGVKKMVRDIAKLPADRRTLPNDTIEIDAYGTSRLYITL